MGNPIKSAMLARMLVVLRKLPPEDDATALAKTFGVHRNTLDNWEDPLDHVIPYHQLLNYQAYYGIPPGCAYTIADMAALARDGDSRRLQNLARILMALARRVLEPGHEPTLTSYRETLGGGALSDRIIGQLLEAVRKEVSKPQRDCFADPKVRAAYRRHMTAGGVRRGSVAR